MFKRSKKNIVVDKRGEHLRKDPVVMAAREIVLAETAKAAEEATRRAETVQRNKAAEAYFYGTNYSAHAL